MQPTPLPPLHGGAEPEPGGTADPARHSAPVGTWAGGQVWRETGGPGRPPRSPGEQVGVAVVVGQPAEEGAGLQDEGRQRHARQVHARPQLLQQQPHQAPVLLGHGLHLGRRAALPAEGARSGPPARSRPQLALAAGGVMGGGVAVPLPSAARVPTPGRSGPRTPAAFAPCPRAPAASSLAHRALPGLSPAWSLPSWLRKPIWGLRTTPCLWQAVPCAQGDPTPPITLHDCRRHG